MIQSSIIRWHKGFEHCPILGLIKHPISGSLIFLEENSRSKQISNPQSKLQRLNLLERCRIINPIMAHTHPEDLHMEPRKVMGFSKFSESPFFFFEGLKISISPPPGGEAGGCRRAWIVFFERRSPVYDVIYRFIGIYRWVFKLYYEYI